MSKQKLSGKDLRAIGYPQSPVISVALSVIDKEFAHLSKKDALELLRSIIQSPNQYAHDGKLGTIAAALVPAPTTVSNELSLNQTAIDVAIFGREGIEEGALQQMAIAAKLPVAVAGALMPDAHHGYGLPIGGVLATQNAVIPYGVGVDIGCRMCLSIFDIAPKQLVEKQSYFKRILNEIALFGSGAIFKKGSDHEVMNRNEWNEIGVLKGLQQRAEKQLGSSGSGNHFVEFGVVEITQKDDVLGVEPGNYVGLLSHSGSRAMGAAIANHYTKLAKEARRLPPDAVNLAWLLLTEEAGIEYWLAMNLAGDYASACHYIIHHKIAAQLGTNPLKTVENHHNFAWKETWNGEEVIVHRKGATPAGKNVLGVIPGSMASPGFIVKGKGEKASVQSASHGAGRRLSRTAALKTVTHKELNEVLQKQAITLLGGGLDEAPFAYKDIFEVMKAQTALVETVGLFHPKIVKMDDAGPKQWKKGRSNATAKG